MDTEQKLTEYLKEKYKPTSLVLHGSRANGMARTHSDWDIVMFTKHDVKPNTREIIFGANLELKQVILPVPEDKFLGFFFRSENTKILYDPESIAKQLLVQNDAKVSEGNHFTNEDRTKRYAFLSSALDGIIDYKDNPLCLFDKKIDFYTRTIDAWFRFKKSEFEPSHYFAFPVIEKEDPEFFVFIQDFVTKDDTESLLIVGRKIIGHLFPDLK
jgi:predicted nucleotidyltransferase